MPALDGIMCKTSTTYNVHTGRCGCRLGHAASTALSAHSLIPLGSGMCRHKYIKKWKSSDVLLREMDRWVIHITYKGQHVCSKNHGSAMLCVNTLRLLKQQLRRLFTLQRQRRHNSQHCGSMKSMLAQEQGFGERLHEADAPSFKLHYLYVVLIRKCYSEIF